ncbi:reverse transcriptase domain-containing protein [Tanacetum coccineum]
MESVFHISNGVVEGQVKTVGHDAAYEMPWKTLMKMMTENYCLRSEIKKLETESPTAANNQRTLTCFECGNQGHYRSECPKLKNQNHGNQAESGEARGRCMPWRRKKADRTYQVEDERDA